MNNNIKINCFCGHEFLFCEDKIPDNSTYEARCPSCHAFIKRKKFTAESGVSQNCLNVKTYNKLVRDKIPDIIKSNGEKCQIEILDDVKYLEELQKKLDEEVAEYHKDQTVEELADIVEVVYAIAATMGYSNYEFEMLRFVKKVDKGGFEEKIFLKETYNE